MVKMMSKTISKVVIASKQENTKVNERRKKKAKNHKVEKKKSAKQEGLKSAFAGHCRRENRIANWRESRAIDQKQFLVI